MQLITVHILFSLISAAALSMALWKRNWLSSCVCLAYLSSSLFMIVDSSGLKYHSLSLEVLSTFTYVLILYLDRTDWNSKGRIALTILLGPFLLYSVMSLFKLGVLSLVRWILTVSLLSFLFITIDRRKWDQHWLLLLYISLSCLWILFQ